jgi:hypothetical protein
MKGNDQKRLQGISQGAAEFDKDPHADGVRFGKRLARSAFLARYGLSGKAADAERTLALVAELVGVSAPADEHVQ